MTSKLDLQEELSFHSQEIMVFRGEKRGKSLPWQTYKVVEGPAELGREFNRLGRNGCLAVRS